MISGRELALSDYRMAQVAVREALAAQPRQLLNVTAKSAGAPFPFNKIDADASGPVEKLSRPYAQSAWVMRAIQLKVGEVTSVPVKFYLGDQEFTSPEFAAFWSRPFLAPGGKRLTMAEGQERLIGWLDLRGEAFVVRGDDWLVPFPEMAGAKLTPLIVARPDRMRPILAGTELTGWEFSDGAGRRWYLLPEQVEHITLWNPYDESRGLSPLEAVMNAAESDYLAGVYVRNLMRNNGDQGVYVIAKGGAPTQEQREQITAVLREKRRAATRGDFRPVFLTGDVAIEDAKAQAPDANLNATRLLDRHTVFIGLGVPASMADVQASYSIGSDSDRARLVTGTCQPLAKRVNAPLAAIASQQTGKALTAESDWDEHPVIQQIRRDRMELACKLWDKGMSWQVVNDQLDLGLRPFPGWEIPYLPFSVAPAGDAGPEPAADPADDPALAETAADPAFEESAPAKMVKLALMARRRVCVRSDQPSAVSAQPDPFAMFACACHGIDGVVMAARSERELAQWRTLMSKRRETVKSFGSAFSRVVMQARIETLRKIEANAGKAIGLSALNSQLSTNKAAAADLLFDLGKFAASMRDVLAAQHKKGLSVAGRQLLEELGKDDPFTYPPEAVVQFLRARENKLKDVPQEIYDRVKSSIEEALQGGETAAEIAGRVKAEFTQISDAQARTIGLTETAAVYGAGRAQAMKQAGVQWKAWLTSGNANVRQAHADANGQTVQVHEPFIVDGEALMHPGDDAGSAGNVINCHCVSIAKASGPEEET